MLPDRSFAPRDVPRSGDDALRITVARVSAPGGTPAAVVAVHGPGAGPGDGSGRASAASSALRDCLAALVDSGVPLVIVDLRDAGPLDATDVGVLSGAAARLAHRGGRLVLVRPDDGPLARMMRLAGLDGVLPGVGHPRDALAHAPAPA